MRIVAMQIFSEDPNNDTSKRRFLSDSVSFHSPLQLERTDDVPVIHTCYFRAPSKVTAGVAFARRSKFPARI